MRTTRARLAPFVSSEQSVRLTLACTFCIPTNAGFSVWSLFKRPRKGGSLGSRCSGWSRLRNSGIRSVAVHATPPPIRSMVETEQRQGTQVNRTPRSTTGRGKLLAPSGDPRSGKRSILMHRSRMPHRKSAPKCHSFYNRPTRTLIISPPLCQPPLLSASVQLFWVSQEVKRSHTLPILLFDLLLLCHCSKAKVTAGKLALAKANDVVNDVVSEGPGAGDDDDEPVGASGRRGRSRAAAAATGPGATGSTPPKQSNMGMITGAKVAQTELEALEESNRYVARVDSYSQCCDRGSLLTLICQLTHVCIAPVRQGRGGHCRSRCRHRS